MTERELVSQIKKAFAATPPPGIEDLDICDDPNDEGVVDYFRGTTWLGHRPQDLRYHGIAMFLFTDEAYRYWLPAFMLAVLENPSESDDIVDRFAWIFTSTERARERHRGFSRDEILAIAAFLDEAVTYRHGDVVRKLLELDDESN